MDSPPDVPLEVLLLLQRSPDTYWTAAAVASSVGCEAADAARVLDQLAKRGVLVRATSTAGAYRYAPVNEVLRAFSNAFRIE